MDNTQLEVIDGSTSDMDSIFTTEPVVQATPPVTTITNQAPPVQQTNDDEVNDHAASDEGNDDPYKEVFTAVYDTLKEKGIVSEVPDFDGSEDSLMKAFEKRDLELKDDLYNQISGELGEKGLALINHLRNNGSVDDFISAYKDPLSGMNPNNTAHQKEILRTFLKQKGWDDIEAENEIQDAEDLGKLTEKAQKAYDKLKQMQVETQANLESQREAKLAEDNIKKETVKRSILGLIDSKGEINGIPLPQDVREKQALKDYMTKENVRLPNGKIVTQYIADQIKDSDNFEAYIYKAILSKNKYNLDFIKAAQETAVTKSVKDKLQNSGFGARLPRSKTNSSDQGSRPKLDWDNLFLKQK